VTADLLTSKVQGAGSNDEQRQDPLEMQWLEFAESLRSRKDPETNALVGVAALRIVDRVRKSIAEAGGIPDREDDSALGG